MPFDDADRLGPKGHVYVEPVRDQWRAPLERGSARRAILTAFLGVALIVFGVAGAFVANGESVFLVAIGALALVTAVPELRPLRPEFEEARRIGWVEPALDDTHVSIGEPAIFRAVLHARRTLSLQNAAVVTEARQYSGSKPGDVLVTQPVPVSLTGGAIRAGEDWRQSVTFRLPSSAPPSYYDSVSSVRWTITLELTFANEPPWRRTWPMLVFPADVV